MTINVTDEQSTALVELAQRLFPEDGYDTLHENTHASVFSMLCAVTQIYVTAGAEQDGHAPGPVDTETTLMAVGENMHLDCVTGVRISAAPSTNYPGKIYLDPESGTFTGTAPLDHPDLQKCAACGSPVRDNICTRDQWHAVTPR